ncbi:Rhodanese-like domain/cysteine-rich domain protein [Pseudodesulfovibrio piezophilus C1TLV30]|uniref:Rhodanese-like domain/cysteine-rich domain protein n=2 Tax=Pseudodesulfovibrio TaxID=2035811 RepID=M1WPA9_PSEP2|nr:Rhodanese-like domain/cysteine-rich domain protein [Pseudodesulfovibrio piezophilus C1TLV30]
MVPEQTIGFMLTHCTNLEIRIACWTMTIEREYVSGMAARLEADCTGCGGCRVHCAFLGEYGTPGEIATAVRLRPQEEWPDPFHCSLCGLCGAICPESLRPEEFFLEMRRTHEQNGLLDLATYAPVMTYEKIGKSRLFSLLRLPDGGDTVLFPGCALPGTRPRTVRRLFLALRNHIPDLGVALGCCLKPSHDLGRKDFFENWFDVLYARLRQAGVKRVITACPNCQKIFSSYGGPLESVPAYSLLAEAGIGPNKPFAKTVVIHDPCPQRYDALTQKSVRTLAQRCGLTVEKGMPERQKTRCCGEGGAVKFARSEFADAWTAQRTNKAAGRTVLTSCAGCVNFLQSSMETEHILDVLFDSKPTRPIRPPLTYLFRLWVKGWFVKTVR